MLLWVAVGAAWHSAAASSVSTAVEIKKPRLGLTRAFLDFSLTRAAVENPDRFDLLYKEKRIEMLKNICWANLKHSVRLSEIILF